MHVAREYLSEPAWLRLSRPRPVTPQASSDSVLLGGIYHLPPELLRGPSTAIACGFVGVPRLVGASRRFTMGCSLTYRSHSAPSPPARMPQEATLTTLTVLYP